MESAQEKLVDPQILKEFAGKLLLRVFDSCPLLAGYLERQWVGDGRIELVFSDVPKDVKLQIPPLFGGAAYEAYEFVDGGHRLIGYKITPTQSDVSDIDVVDQKLTTDAKEAEELPVTADQAVVDKLVKLGESEELDAEVETAIAGHIDAKKKAAHAELKREIDSAAQVLAREFLRDGQPVSRTEIESWLDSHADHPALDFIFDSDDDNDVMRDEVDFGFSNVASKMLNILRNRR